MAEFEVEQYQPSEFQTRQKFEFQNFSYEYFIR